MCNETIQFLLNSASAYALLAQSLRSDGVSSWVYYHNKMLEDLREAKRLKELQDNNIPQLMLVA